MMLTFLLARVFGTYLIIAGIALLARKRFVMSVLGGFTEEKTAEIGISVFLILTGLFVINFHHDWSSLAAGLVSAIGLGMFFKGALIMLLPENVMAKIGRAFRKPAYILADGILILVIGAYLAGVGYGFIGA